MLQWDFQNENSLLNFKTHSIKRKEKHDIDKTANIYDMQKVH